MNDIADLFVTSPVARPPWPIAADPVAVKIKSFANLPEGWHFGEGGPIKRRVIDAALMWHSFLVNAGIHRIGATPGERGTVVVASLINDKYTEIISEPNRTFTVVRDRENGRSIYRRDLTENQVKDLINQLLRGSWNMSAGFTPVNLTTILGDSVVRRSATSRVAAARDSQSLTVSVSSLPALRYVSMR
jgi:hypothetical protein